MLKKMQLLSTVKAKESINLSHNSTAAIAFEYFTKDKELFKCRKCGKLLAYERILLGVVEIKCSRCKTNNMLVFDAIDAILKIIEDARKSKKKT